MSEFTPGPWITDKLHYGRIGIRRKQRDELTGCYRIAYCGTSPAAGGNNVLAQIKEAEANACLISAAPDLYEACKTMRDLLKSEDIRIEGRNFLDLWADTVFRQVDAALAKAEASQ